MSDEDIRIAIAEACGWTNIREQDYYEGTGCSDDDIRQFWEGVSPDGEKLPVPDYLNDLNACHEFEKTLNSDQRWIYDKKLCVVIMNSGIHVDDAWLWHATARQRCEAFLKVHESRAKVS